MTRMDRAFRNSDFRIRFYLCKYSISLLFRSSIVNPFGLFAFGADAEATDDVCCRFLVFFSIHIAAHQFQQKKKTYFHQKMMFFFFEGSNQCLSVRHEFE